MQNTLDYCEKTNEYLRESSILLEYYNIFKASTCLQLSNQPNIMENGIFDCLLYIIEVHYPHLLIILPIFLKENFNLLTYDIKVYLINIFFLYFY